MKGYLIKLLSLFCIIKTTFKEFLVFIKINYLRFSTKTRIRQIINYKSIPIIIISFNQLSCLKQLIDFLKKHKYNNIVIIDNNSTYKPLLEYFDTIESSVKLYRLKENYGHLVFWKKKELFGNYTKGYYVISDADIIPVPECPDDFVRYFKKILDHNKKITKVGFSLKIDDIPENNSNKGKILKWESQFWNIQNKDGNFRASIDTTFALYRPNYYYNEQNFYDACRTKMPYQARHDGWYLDTNNLNEDQLFYFANCNESSSWRIDEQGNLKNKEAYK